MEYTNYTPFPTLCFETLWPDNCEYYTIVVRATANIIPDDLLDLADEQLPLVITDAYFGQPGASSLRYPNDLSPFKPKTDIILNASAYIPPNLKRGCVTSLKVGDLVKKLAVIGPRFWKKSFMGWQLTDLVSIKTQPIRYEFAFGGIIKYKDEKGEVKVIDVYQNNPVGTGWWSALADKLNGGIKQIPAPQIYAYATKMLPVFGKEYLPEGYGAIAPTWSSRRKYAGTWKAPAEGEETPSYPPDFNQLFYSSAHPDLIVPYLAGNEQIELLNLTPSGKLHFQLPGHTVFVSARYSNSDNEVTKVPAHLDTLIIEPDEMRVGMVWRATLPVSEELSALETRMIFNEKKGEKEVSA
jgi:hypothetical protein